MPNRAPFEIGKCKIAPGDRQTVELPVSVLSDHTPVTLSVHVVHGRRSGPTLFVSAAVHGDEVIGVEIARRLMHLQSLKSVKGTLLIAPIVNTFGFLNHSRYLPDRRDLNRFFPGSPTGSLAARLAHLFTIEIIARSDFGIDLHSAAIHRTNLPQVRVSPSNPETFALAEAFGAPVVLIAPVREGSMRHAAQKNAVGMLLYEGGEALRFDEFAVRAGVTGILRVMHKLGMISAKGVSKPKVSSVQSASSFWLRAPEGGLLRCFKNIGEEVKKEELLGMIADPLGESETEVLSSDAGLIIGRTNLPIVNEGDGLFHIAKVKRGEDVEVKVGDLAIQLEEDPLFDEDEII